MTKNNSELKVDLTSNSGFSDLAKSIKKMNYREKTALRRELYFESIKFLKQHGYEIVEENPFKILRTLFSDNQKAMDILKIQSLLSKEGNLIFSQ